jgi:hypothetical protein
LPRQSIITASRKGCIHVATEYDIEWISDSLEFPSEGDREAFQVLPLESLGAFLVARSHSVDLIDVHDYRTLHRFQTEAIRPRSLKCHYSSRRKPECRCIGVSSISLVYTSDESADCIIQTYIPSDDGDTVCVGNAVGSGNKACSSWSETRETKKTISNPGSWETLPSGCVVGVRKVMSLKETSSGESSPTQGGLRRRIYRAESEPVLTKDEWEVWLVSQLGRHDLYETMPLRADEDQALGLELGRRPGGGLMITHLGPMVKVGMASVAVAFGDVIKLITIGHEHFDKPTELLGGDPSLMNIASRRRRGLGSSRPRVTPWR